VRLTVPRRGGWRAWGVVRADFERGLADAADPAIASAGVASELRRCADNVRVTIAFTVVTTDVADALAIAWDVFRSAARDYLAGWEVTAAAAKVQPEPSLIQVGCHTQRCSPAFRPRAGSCRQGKRLGNVALTPGDQALSNSVRYVVRRTRVLWSGDSG